MTYPSARTADVSPPSSSTTRSGRPRAWTADRPGGQPRARASCVNTPNSQFNGKKWKAIREGGFKIIHHDRPAGAGGGRAGGGRHRRQGSLDDAEAAGELQAALVAVEPGTGRVLAYFGGHDGTGSDYAGWSTTTRTAWRPGSAGTRRARRSRSTRWRPR